MTHYIQDGGPFDVAASVFLADHVAVDWASAPGGADGKGKAAKASARSKTKYTCPVCQQNAWAKPGAMLACANGEKHPDGLAVIMVADADGDSSDRD